MSGTVSRSGASGGARRPEWCRVPFSQTRSTSEPGHSGTGVTSGSFAPMAIAISRSTTGRPEWSGRPVCNLLYYWNLCPCDRTRCRERQNRCRDCDRIHVAHQKAVGRHPFCRLRDMQNVAVLQSRDTQLVAGSSQSCFPCPQTQGGMALPEPAGLDSRCVNQSRATLQPPSVRGAEKAKLRAACA